MRLIVAFAVAFFSVQPCFAWWEGGHHLIGVMAFDNLDIDQQREIIELLKSHPRFAEDFTVPEKGGEPDRWLIGRAGYWPDVARRSPLDRPTWHYQLGSTLVIGDVKNVPENPGPPPAGGSLNTKELHIAQALELCRGVWRDRSKPNADRALALCWIAHLVADSHQPCHAGSLYTTVLFPEGDRGANSIPTKQSKNLHALWDSLLGPNFDAGDIRRRQREIESDTELSKLASHAAGAVGGLDPMTWLAESRELGKTHVYAPEVLEPVRAADANATKLETIKLSEDYLKAAGRMSRLRAAYAAARLAAILCEGLK